MKKIYYVHQKNHKDAQPEIRSLEIIAETEYHWTYMIEGGMTSPRAFACPKSESTLTAETPEKAWELFVNNRERDLDRHKANIERTTTILMHLRDNKEKLIEEAKR